MALTALDFPASPTNGQLYPDPPVTGQPQYSWNGTQWLSSKAAVTQIARTDALGWSGMQINGSMEVSQERGTTGTSANGYVIDGWAFANVSAGVVFTAQYPITNNPGFPNALVMTVITQSAMTAGDVVYIHHSIEGYRVARLGWGTASAQPITLGFWVNHARAGIFTGTVRNSAANRTYAFSYTQNVGGAWEYKTITIPGCADGAWVTGNTTGMTIAFAVACGTNFTAPSLNNWVTGNYLAGPGQINGITLTSDVFRLTGVVVLPGIEAPTAAQSPLIMRPYDQELMTCQRYYWRDTAPTWMQAENVSVGASANYLLLPIKYPVTMRSAPTITMPSMGVTGVPAMTFPLVSPTASGAVSAGLSNVAAGGRMFASYGSGSLSVDARL